MMFEERKMCVEVKLSQACHFAEVGNLATTLVHILIGLERAAAVNAVSTACAMQKVELCHKCTRMNQENSEAHDMLDYVYRQL